MSFLESVCTKRALIVLTTGLLLAASSTAAEFTPVPNADFTQGDGAPAGWRLSGGKGRRVDGKILEVTGNGQDSNYWRCDYRFTPGGLYRFQVRGRGTPDGGSAIAGPAFANRDYRTPSNDWTWVDHVFRVPDGVTDSYLRLGQWHAHGTIQFDAVKLTPVLPAHLAVGDLLLGEGESIRDGRYTFSGTFAHESGNYHRPLHSATAGFNSDRWTFGGDSQVTYRFALPGHKFTSAEATFHVNYHTRGGCAAEISSDGTAWRPLLVRSELGEARAKVPDDLFPAGALYLRLESSPRNSSFQVNRIELESALEGSPPDAIGQTVFADIESTIPELAFESPVLTTDPRTGRPTLVVKVRNNTRARIDAKLTTDASSSDDVAELDAGLVVPPGESVAEEVALISGQPGRKRLVLALGEEGKSQRATAAVTFTVPDYYRVDYGERFDHPSDTAVWWCPATHKIPPQHLPAGTGTHARLSAAGNDWEAVQIVVRPERKLKGFSARAGTFAGPHGATIAAANVQILRVAYHFVDHPTDKTGVRDWWPDALPPLIKPIDVPAGKNQPLWVLVHVPKDAKAGDYLGKISLKAKDFSADVPLKLHVWDFTLPERNHVETAFGFSAGNVFRYHGLKTEADKRRVLDMYLQCFADHRISPYDPTPMDPIRVKFLSEADPPRAEVDFSAFDPAMTRAVEKFHFTGFRLPVQGMGGGTFHSRSEPRIGSFGENTPQYQAMFSSYVKQLEDHFRQKGWLEMPYVYWFDEPDPKDYEFVANGMRRLHKYAPGIRRMLTEQPGDNPLAGVVDIWCPVSFNYNHEEAEKRRAHGERFWWYVCCGPKAPYCTLFIDHPATELRVWLWQTWQRNIVGVLVWSSNYWTSSTAFPEVPQNPYEDPMGYVSGYSTPQGTKRYWGNGDGRFIYPPESAAVPGHSGPDPVIEPPVSSIRWEMLREGIEDYEMLYLLRDLLAKRRDTLPPEQIKGYEALLEVPESITRDMTTFTTDPTPIYARRAEIAEAIERLGKQ